jgi:hypothetical protein
MLALQLLLTHFYTAPFGPVRWSLFLVFFAAALPAFGLLERSLSWAILRGDDVVAIVTGVALAAATALIGGSFMERMGVFPIYIVAAALLYYTAYRCGPHGSVARSVFGAFVVSRALSVVCALY